MRQEMSLSVYMDHLGVQVPPLSVSHIVTYSLLSALCGKKEAEARAPPDSHALQHGHSQSTYFGDPTYLTISIS